MAKTIHEFRLNLISKIRQAESIYSIERYVTTARKTLGNKKLNGHLIDRFLARSIDDLRADLIDPALSSKKEKIVAGLKYLQLAKASLAEVAR